ncbi:glycosyl hydrolase family 28-related protein, partial [Streptomyces sp. bgisy130]
MAGRISPSFGGTTRRSVLAGTTAALAAVLTGCGSETRGSRPLVTGDKPEGKDVIDVVADCGAKGDGRTDDSEAFAHAYSQAAERVWDHVGRTVIDVPAGTYLIRSPHALLDAPGGKLKANGLRFRGAGKRMAQLLFAPDKADNAYLCRNEDSWANVMFEQLGFVSG